MIWILLSPFRGTAEPPRLSQNSRTWKAFYQYGNFIARRWLKTLLLFSAIAVFLSYSAWMRYLGPRLENLHVPHRAWTSVGIHRDESSWAGRVPTDFEFRQIWLHGSYKHALGPNALAAAAEIEHILLDNQPGADERVGCSRRLSRDRSWTVLSPSYLSPDGRAGHASAANSRCSAIDPALVLAGQGTDSNGTSVADALVITIVDTDPSTSGTRWDDRLDQVEQTLGHRITFYSAKEYKSHAQLLHFETRAMSYTDEMLLATAYAVMALYVVIFISYQTSLRSRFGLVVSVITEVTFSAIASFLICDYIGVNLGELPHEAYPFIVFVLGLDNVFRLVNALFSLPPQSSAPVRIANALGDVGYLSLITATQNLIVLWILSFFVSPSVVAFCAYAAIALAFDVAFQLTFLIAVISVDVRRIELQESLNKATEKRQLLSPRKRVSRLLFLDLFRDNFQFHSRIAATSIVVLFLLFVDHHFTDRRWICWLGFCNSPQLFRSIKSHLNEIVTIPSTLNRVESLHDWVMRVRFLLLNDVVSSVPHTSSQVVARVYDPVIAVLKDADRTVSLAERYAFITGPLDDLRRHFVPFSITLALTLLFITLLMKFLLWNDASDDDLGALSPRKSLSVQSGFRCHEIDIETIYASRKGHFISVSLDRNVCLNIFQSFRSYGFFELVQFPINELPLWPLKAMAIDDSATTVAAYTQTGSIYFWDIESKIFKRRIDLVSDNESPPEFSTFQFSNPPVGDKEATVLVTLTRTGSLCSYETGLPTNEAPVDVSRNSSIASSIMTTFASGEIRVSFTSQDGQIGVWSKRPETSWTPISSLEPSFEPGESREPEGILFQQPVEIASSLSLIAGVVASEKAVVLSSISGHQRIYTLSLPDETVDPEHLRVLHSIPRTCSSCGSIAVHSLSIAYATLPGQGLAMHTFSRRLEDQELICLGVRSANMVSRASISRQEKPECSTLASARYFVHRVASAGVWETTRSQSIIGIRRQPRDNQVSLLSSSRRPSLSRVTTATASGLSPRTPHSRAPSVSSVASAKPRLRLYGRRTGALPALSIPKARSQPGGFSSALSPGPLYCSGMAGEAGAPSSSTPLATAPPAGPAAADCYSRPWEVYSLSATGEFLSVPLVRPDDDLANVVPNELFQVPAPSGRELLFVTQIRQGPVRLGERSVVVPFGNLVWVISIGPPERFDGLMLTTRETGMLEGNRTVNEWRMSKGGLRRPT